MVDPCRRVSLVSASYSQVCSPVTARVVPEPLASLLSCPWFDVAGECRRYDPLTDLVTKRLRQLVIRDIALITVPFCHGPAPP